MTSDDVEHVIENELALLTHHVRSSADELHDLLAEDFTEIGASGRLWTREEMISMLVSGASTEQPVITHSDMQSRLIGADLVLLTYRTHVEGRQARRSSVWQRRGAGKWVLVHHQGTPVP